MKSLLISLALLALACQSAPAQNDDGQSVPSGTSGSATVSQTTTSDDDGSFTQLTIVDDAGQLSLTRQRDGSVSATHDGVAVPQERLQRDGDHLCVLDASGKTLYDLRLLKGGGIAYPYAGSSEPRMFWGGGSGLEELTFAMTGAGAPRKIIGVVTTPVEGGLAAQLGLDPESAVMINEITPGMPAEKAGLQAFDVIVKIDGQEPITRERLRELITAKDAGQTLRVSLIRKGQPVDLDVEVTETRDDGMNMRSFGTGALADYYHLADSGFDAAFWNADGLDGQHMHEQLDAARADLDAARATLVERIATLQADQQVQGGVAEESRIKVVAELQRALERLAEAGTHMREGGQAGPHQIRFFDVGAEGDRGLLVRQPSGAYSIGVGPAGAPGAAAVSDDRLKQVEERLAQLDARLTELLGKLDSAGSKP